MSYRVFMENVLGDLGEFGVNSRIVFEKSGGNYTATTDGILFTGSQWSENYFMTDLNTGVVTKIQAI